MIRSDQMRLSPGLARPRQSQFTQLHRRRQMLRLEKCRGSEGGRFHQMQIKPARLVLFQLYTKKKKLFFFFEIYLVNIWGGIVFTGMTGFTYTEIDLHQ